MKFRGPSTSRAWTRIAALTAGAAARPGVAAAHEALGVAASAASDPAEIWRSWEWDPLVVIGLLAAAILYGVGARRARPAMGAASDGALGGAARDWRARVLCFASGVLILFLALVSPVHRWGSVLFSAHMVQHELLMIAAAPLIALGSPARFMLLGLPRGAARAVGRALAARPIAAARRAAFGAISAWGIHAAALWAWHIPALFEAALRHRAAHALQHASFLGTALMFWSAVFDGGRGGVRRGAAVVFLFTTAAHSGLLGAMLALAGRVWYPAYAASGRPWGLSALDDQRLGGLIMWIPAGLVYLAAALVLFAAWLRDSDAAAERAPGPAAEREPIP